MPCGMTRVAIGRVIKVNSRLTSVVVAIVVVVAVAVAVAVAVSVSESTENLIVVAIDIHVSIVGSTIATSREILSAK